MARTVAHVELNDHLVNVVFVLFDENGELRTATLCTDSDDDDDDNWKAVQSC